MPEPVLADRLRIWQSKPVLRAVYEDMYRRIVDASVSGPTLEVGGGSGNLQAFLDQVVSTDLEPVPWLDAAADAHALPFPDRAFANLVGFDVLHHLSDPHRFFLEAARVLLPGGRIILVEPAITPASSFVYRRLHPEPVDMTVDPLSRVETPPGEPFPGNQAVPTLLFGRHRERFEREIPVLKVLTLDWLSFAAYPLSGGFRNWSLLPAVLAPALLGLEARVPRPVARLLAFRLFVVIGKDPG